MEQEKEYYTHFIKHRHRFLVGHEEPDTMYRKAYLCPEEDANREYDPNTTTWD